MADVQDDCCCEREDGEERDGEELGVLARQLDVDLDMAYEDERPG